MILANLPEFVTGTTLGQWITSAGIVTLVIAFLRRDIQLRKLSKDEEADIRDHYAQEVEAMREQLRSLDTHYRHLLQASDERHEECQKDRDDLRVKVRKLEDDVHGLQKRLLRYSADKLIILEDGAKPSDTAPASVAAARRIKEQE